ncbi:MerR family transcriptional regulator [Bradyrhizobium lablabi]|uniref:MerR family transcriptional regulator n=1 Tax=Bradyrhizobium lablabi TaxID=722472 RepID=A0A0R3N2X6_9BRAD|nr:MerR family transcriptional regulator [Bradyrhizobium lablabi]KRR23830.1 MerR family transcriptional regulator [Bradyrhizobium lablabi]
MDKAPDAFRTISEVAEELDIPQHVLRFWETRFAQIKPMKRSGGRRYYRPDDVDLLKGIRRLLYGEGYTIRGVQRILKEHGIKSVQGLADQTSAVTFGAVEEAIGLSLQEPEEGEIPTADAEAEDEDYETEEKEIDYRFVDTDDDGILLPFAKGKPGPSEADRERLERVLQELISCRELLDTAMKDG